MVLSRTTARIEPNGEGKREDLEALISADYEHCHPGETLRDLKHRARFSKEDKGLLRDWLAVAAARAAAARHETMLSVLPIAAE